MNHKSRILRFAAIGILNTLVDIVIFLILTKLGLIIFLANIISTSVALILSYILNKKVTFNDRLSGKRTVISFFAVTLIGLWILQPLIIYLVIALIPVSGLPSVLPIIASQKELIGKLAATGASMVWNYLLYDRIVFHKK